MTSNIEEPSADPRPNRAARRRRQWLQFVLRLMGGCELLALVAVFLPVATMQAIHARLGLGPMAGSLLEIYLARVVSLLYAFHGAVLIALATDVAGLVWLIRLWGRLTLLAGAGLLGIDLIEHVPLWWTLFEGPVVMVMGSLFVTLARDD